MDYTDTSVKIKKLLKFSYDADQVDEISGSFINKTEKIKFY